MKYVLKVAIKRASQQSHVAIHWLRYFLQCWMSKCAWRPPTLPWTGDGNFSFSLMFIYDIYSTYFTCKKFKKKLLEKCLLLEFIYDIFLVIFAQFLRIFNILFKGNIIPRDTRHDAYWDNNQTETKKMELSDFWDFWKDHTRNVNLKREWEILPR